MRVLVTGATGFVGRWLVAELEGAGHTAIASPSSSRLDVTDEVAVRDFVHRSQPDAIAHLAGVSHAFDASRDPRRALAVNEGGTRNVLQAVAGSARPIPIIVSGSSEVYGDPTPGSLPLREEARLRTERPYGLSKLAQERTALEIGARERLPIAVTRSFNHTGPGQRAEFVAPALTRRVIDAKRNGTHEVAVGNLDVRRDIGDVRDVARAYRLIIEGLSDGSVPAGSILNVATGRAIGIHTLLEILGDQVGIVPVPIVDPGLLRDGDPPIVVGDATRLRALTGWVPEIPIERTLGDLVASLI